MSRTCQRCGATVALQSGRGRPRKYCDTCTPSRGASKPTVIAKATVPARAESPRTAGLLAATRAELTEAGVIDSMAGQAALILARRIEDESDSGASLAQMIKQLRDTAAAAKAGAVQVVADPVDEFSARRREREGA